MLEQSQTKLKQAEITAAGTMNDLVQARLHSVCPEIDDPEVSKTCGDHQPGKTLGIRKVALVQIESTALLVREEGFDLEAPAVKVAGLFCRAHVGDQMDGLLAVLSPPSDGADRPVFALGERCVGNIKDISGFDMTGNIIKAEHFPFPIQGCCLAGAQDILPLALFHESLQIHTIELPVPEQHHPSSLRNQLLYLADQLDVNPFREMPLLPLGHNPGNGQCPLLVDDADHERHAAAADNTSIDYQHQRSMAQAEQQSLSERKKEGLGIDGIVSDPSLEALDTTLGQCPWNLLGDCGKIRAFTAHDSTDDCGQGIQSTGQMPLGLPWEKRSQ